MKVQIVVEIPEGAKLEIPGEQQSLRGQTLARSNAVLAMVRKLGMIPMAAADWDIWDRCWGIWRHRVNSVDVDAARPLPVEVKTQLNRALLLGMFDELWIHESKHKEIGGALFGCIGSTVYQLSQWGNEIYSPEWLKRAQKVRIVGNVLPVLIFTELLCVVFGWIGYSSGTEMDRSNGLFALWGASITLVGCIAIGVWNLRTKRRLGMAFNESDDD